MTESKSDIEYNKIVDLANNSKSLHLEDNKFHMVALNLSGRREQLEQEATKLINKHGTLKALKMSGQTKEKPC